MDVTVYPSVAIIRQPDGTFKPRGPLPSSLWVGMTQFRDERAIASGLPPSQGMFAKIA
jgi:hypothetical protein